MILNRFYNYILKYDKQGTDVESVGDWLIQDIFGIGLGYIFRFVLSRVNNIKAKPCDKFSFVGFSQWHVLQSVVEVASSQIYAPVSNPHGVQLCQT